MATLKRARTETSDMVHIYSTLANPQTFAIYERGPNDMPRVVLKATIGGGTGVASKHLVTPLGVHTAMERDVYNQIKETSHFKDFLARGFIVVQDREAAKVESVTGEMNLADPSAPLTPSDFQNTDPLKDVVLQGTE